MGVKRPERGAGVGDVDMSGETAVVTGSTSGIGKETALSLARLGAHVIIHGRDEERGKEVRDRASETEGSAELKTADFSTFGNVCDFAQGVTDSVDSLDVLVNNAGGWFSKGRLTEDGIEHTFAVNHLAPYVLTAKLLPMLEESNRGRIIMTSSNAHRGGTHSFTVEDVTDITGYRGFSAYCRSKLANVLFTRELAKRLREGDSSVTANSFHPGAVPGTGFPRGTPTPLRIAAKALVFVPEKIESAFVTTVPEGAQTPVLLAASPKAEGISGHYFKDLRPIEPSSQALDDRKAETLWKTSRELTGVEYDIS